MKPGNRTFLGRGGEFFILSEFLARGYNVAIPEVDLGDDVLVIQDHQDDSETWRVQVKTSQATLLRQGKGRVQGKFNVKTQQLLTPVTPPLYYAFLRRNKAHWEGLLIIPRDWLSEAFQAQKSNPLVKLKEHALARHEVTFCFVTEGPSAYWSFETRAKKRVRLDVTRFRDDWSLWPTIERG